MIMKAASLSLWSTLSIISLVLLCSFGNSYAFDGKRKGFILGGGIGLGTTSFTQSASDFNSGRETKLSLTTDFKIGGGFSEQLLLYYTSRVSWFSLRNVYDETVIVASGIGGVGVTYFPKPDSDFYLLGGLGLATWGDSF